MGARSKRPRPRQAHRNHHDFTLPAVKKNFSADGHKLPKGSSSSSVSLSLSGPNKLMKTGKQQQLPPPPHHHHQHQVLKKKKKKKEKHSIPFRPSDHILFVGEGDFSFTLSLVEHHRCYHITATCYDSETVLHEKYPRAREILDRLLSHGSNHASGAARHLEPEETIEEAEGTGGGGGGGGDGGGSLSEWNGLSPSPSPSDDFHPPTDSPSTTVTDGSRSAPLPSTPANGNISFHTSISAYSLSRCKPIRRKAPYHKIVFNFPHVGGLSTDVNRQVRANQELLVAFFKSCRPLLASRSNPVPSDRSQIPAESPLATRGLDDDIVDDDDPSIMRDREESRSEPTNGQVIISLFDGEPYSLWNIRDLARHSGYKLVTSWRFPWEAYPGYRHARTAGEILRKANDAAVVGLAAKADGRAQGHKRKGPWKGEEREARGYVFEMVADDDQGLVDPAAPTAAAAAAAAAVATSMTKATTLTRNKKRKISSSSSSSEPESDA